MVDNSADDGLSVLFSRPNNGATSSTIVAGFPIKLPSNSMASLHKKVHQPSAIGIVAACHRLCASTIRPKGAKSSNSKAIARVVTTTRARGVIPSLCRGRSSGFLGGYGRGYSNVRFPTCILGKGKTNRRLHKIQMRLWTIPMTTLNAV